MMKTFDYITPTAEFLPISDIDLLTASGGGESSIELDEFEIH